MEEAFALDWPTVTKESSVVFLVRSSCAELVVSPRSDVTISDVGLAAFVDEIMSAELLQPAKRAFPLNFPTVKSEVNFLTTLALLQIGSGYRVPLKAQDRGTGKGAAETMTFGVMGMFLCGEITADAMVAVGLFDVAQTFGLKINEDYEISRGIHGERKTELYSLAELIRRILNDTGVMLKSLGCADFFAFFEKFTPKIVEVDESKGDAATGGPSALAIVNRLVRHFKWLQDVYVLPGTVTPADSGDAAATAASSSSSSGTSPRLVYLLKKAQLICSELYNRFHDEPSVAHLFNYSDIGQLTIFADNVIPAMLREKGVLVYTDALATQIDSGVKITNRRTEATIRAAAVVACERIVRAVNAKRQTTQTAAVANTEASAEAPAAPVRPLTEDALDHHLWLLGKSTPAYRALARHATHSGFY